jgi:histidine triad (HIT) family protein
VNCLFCKIAAKEIPSDLVYEDKEVVAFRDINPVATTHILIIPRKHIASTNDLDESHAELVGKMHLVAKKLAALEKIGEPGYRLVLNCGPHGGQAVFHVHLHLIGGRQMSWPPG